MTRSVIFICLILQTCLLAFAQEKQADGGLGEAASNATNPMAFVTKLQIQPNFTWKTAAARQINLTTRIIQPTGSVGLPFIKSKNPSKVYTLYRIELPIIGQTYPETPELDATALSDVILLDLIAFKQKWGLLGVGPGIIIPTMNPKPITSGKWSAGFTAVALNTKTKGCSLAFWFSNSSVWRVPATGQRKTLCCFNPYSIKY